MFSSTIIPTVGRESLIFSVRSLLDQEFTPEDFEVIVVNDSGSPLPEADWHFSPRVKIIDTQRRERGAARNTGAAVARGRYLHFLDDDDILLPGGLQAFWQLSQAAPDAVWLHGHYQSVDNDGQVLREFDPEMEGDIFANLIAGEAIPLQASLLESATFFRVGEFDPTIPGVEDRDIGRRMALAGRTAGTCSLVASIRVGQAGSTTDWSRIAEMDRWSREKALREQGAYAKLVASAKGSWWRGRVCRAYLASMAWNLRRRNGLLALSRALAAISVTHIHAFSPRYWAGLRTRIG